MPKPYGDIIVKSIRDENGNAIGGLPPFTPSVVPFANGVGVLTEDAVFYYDSVNHILYPKGLKFPTTAGYLQVFSPVANSVRWDLFRNDGQIIGRFEMDDNGDVYIKSSSNTLVFCGSLEFDPTIPAVLLSLGANSYFNIRSSTGSALNVGSNGTVTLKKSVTAVGVSPYALTAFQDDILLVTTGAAAFTVTLPNPINIGIHFTVKKVDVGAGVCTVTPFGAETIDGAVNYALAAQWKYITIVSDGANWNIIGNN